MGEAAFRRLDVDERRRQLLRLGVELFAEHAYDELSMRKIAKAAGISHPLLYRYFPSKQSYFRAALDQAAEDLRERTAPDPSLPPWEQLVAGLEGFLALIDENPLAYRQLLRSLASAPEVRELIDEVRDTTSQRILDGLFPDHPAPPPARAAVRGGSGTWTGCCSTGSTTATWTARRFATSCWGRSAARWPPRRRA